MVVKLMHHGDELLSIEPAKPASEPNAPTTWPTRPWLKVHLFLRMLDLKWQSIPPDISTTKNLTLRYLITFGACLNEAPSTARGASELLVGVRT